MVSNNVLFLLASTPQVSHFRGKGWWVCSVDVRPNDEADENVLVDLAEDWQGQGDKVGKAVAGKLSGSKVDAILNMAGNGHHLLACVLTRSWVTTIEVLQNSYPFLWSLLGIYFHYS